MCTYQCDSHVDWHQRLSMFCCKHVDDVPAFAGPTLPAHKRTTGGGISTATAHKSLGRMCEGTTAAYKTELHN